MKTEPENKQERDTDASVQKMVETWDKVKCHYCKKEISMLNAKMTPDKQFFICKGH